MHNIIDKIKSYSEQINLEERFNYEFKIDVSVLDSHIIEKLSNTDSAFKKNVILKDLLKYQYQKDIDNTRLDFWIINSWGGIYGFKPTERNITKVSKFKQELKLKKLSKDNFETISSLSKIASFLDPEKYFIYDARVAYSLNWLILKYENRDIINHKYFPMPNSRNKSLINFDIQTILNIAHAKEPNDFSDLYLKPQEAYHAYCNLISRTAEQIYSGTKSAYLIEMLLFIIADQEILAEVKEMKVLI